MATVVVLVVTVPSGVETLRNFLKRSSWGIWREWGGGEGLKLGVLGCPLCCLHCVTASMGRGSVWEPLDS